MIFQPAEEGGAGGKAMVDDGMMDRWDIKEVYGMHNMPGLPPGQFATRVGPLMAATAYLRSAWRPRSPHAAKPHEGIDPSLIGAHIVSALQSISSRNNRYDESRSWSPHRLPGGRGADRHSAACLLRGTVRTLDAGVREMVERRFKQICDGTAKMVRRGSAPRITSAAIPHREPRGADAGRRRTRARRCRHERRGRRDGADHGRGRFLYMLEARPGAFIFIGNGDTAGLHHPAYDFHDEIIPAGIQYWALIAEKAGLAR